MIIEMKNDVNKKCWK